MKKIMILQIIADSTLSGAPMTLLNFAKAVNKKKFEIICLCPPGPLADSIAKIAEVKLKTLVMDSKFNLITIIKLHKLISFFSPDIVDCQGVRGGWLGRLACIGLRKPAPKVVYTEHLWTKEYQLKNPFSHWLQVFLLKCLDSLTDKTIAVSQAVADFLIANRITKQGKVVVAYSGLELPDTKTISKLSKPTKTIGFVGSLTKRKGVKYLIQALFKLLQKTSGKNLQLIIVGDGPERSKLNSLVQELRLGKFVKFTGSITNTADFYPTFDVYVQPSIDEAFGFAVVEAMSYGLPIVASKVGGLREILHCKPESSNKKSSQITDCGILVPPQNSDTLAQAVLRILEDQILAEKMRRAARARAQEFSLKNTIPKKEKIYLKIIKQSGQGERT